MIPVKINKIELQYFFTALGFHTGFFGGVMTGVRESCSVRSKIYSCREVYSNICL